MSNVIAVGGGEGRRERGIGLRFMVNVRGLVHGGKFPEV